MRLRYSRSSIFYHIYRLSHLSRRRAYTYLRKAIRQRSSTGKSGQNIIRLAMMCGCDEVRETEQEYIIKAVSASNVCNQGRDCKMPCASSVSAVFFLLFFICVVERELARFSISCVARMFEELLPRKPGAYGWHTDYILCKILFNSYV